MLLAQHLHINAVVCSGTEMKQNEFFSKTKFIFCIMIGEFSIFFIQVLSI